MPTLLTELPGSLPAFPPFSHLQGFPQGPCQMCKMWVPDVFAWILSIIICKWFCTRRDLLSATFRIFGLKVKYCSLVSSLTWPLPLCLNNVPLSEERKRNGGRENSHLRSSWLDHSKGRESVGEPVALHPHSWWFPRQVTQDTQPHRANLHTALLLLTFCPCSFFFFSSVLCLLMPLSSLSHVILSIFIFCSLFCCYPQPPPLTQKYVHI